MHQATAPLSNPPLEGQSAIGPAWGGSRPSAKTTAVIQIAAKAESHEWPFRPTTRLQAASPDRPLLACKLTFGRRETRLLESERMAPRPCELAFHSRWNPRQIPPVADSCRAICQVCLGSTNQVCQSLALVRSRKEDHYPARRADNARHGL